MGPNADRRGLRHGAALWALIACGCACSRASRASADEPITHVLATVVAETPAPARHEPDAVRVAEDWPARVAAAAAGLRASDAAERRRAAVELEALLDELANAARAGSEVAADQAQAFATASVSLARLAAEDRPEGLDPRTVLERACEVTAAQGSHGRQAFAALKLAEHLLGAGDVDDARAVLRSAVERLDRDFATRTQMRLLLARIAATAGELDRALVELDEAEALLDEIDPDWAYWALLKGDVLASRCSHLLLVGNPDRALRAVAELRALGLEHERPDLVARSHLHAARVHFALGRGAEVVRSLERAREGADRLGATERGTLDLLGALVRSESTDPERSSAAEDELAAIVERGSRLATDRERARLRLAELALARGELELATERIASARAALDPDTSEGHVQLAALGAEVALAGGARGSALEAAHAGLEDAFERFLAAWDAAPRAASGAGFLHYASRRRVLDALIRTTLAVHGPDRGPRLAFEALERAQARGSVARAAAYEPRGLDGVRAALCGNGRGLVTYLPSYGRTHAFAVDEERVVHVELPMREGGLEGLEAPRAELVAACTSPPSAEAARAGRGAVVEGEAARELARRLWPAELAAATRGWSGARIAGVEGFGYLPFELLPIGEGEDGEPLLLGDRLALSYLPSVSVGVLLAERPRAERDARDAEVVLIAATEPPEAPGDALPELPLGAPQRAALLGAYDARSVRAYVGEEATLARLLAPETRGASVLQVLAHGVSDFGRERSAGLALADGPAWYEDLERASLPPLVCLWVCHAGRGAARSGEDGLATLGDASLAAGASAVLVSPARIEYRALLELARAFHERLAGGAPPDEALRDARLELASDPERAHPFFSLVHVVGLGDARTLER